MGSFILQQNEIVPCTNEWGNVNKTTQTALIASVNIKTTHSNNYTKLECILSGPCK